MKAILRLDLRTQSVFLCRWGKVIRAFMVQSQFFSFISQESVRLRTGQLPLNKAIFWWFTGLSFAYFLAHPRGFLTCFCNVLSPLFWLFCYTRIAKTGNIVLLHTSVYYLLENNLSDLINNDSVVSVNVMTVEMWAYHTVDMIHLKKTK